MALRGPASSLASLPQLTPAQASSTSSLGSSSASSSAASLASIAPWHNRAKEVVNLIALELDAMARGGNASNAGGTFARRLRGQSPSPAPQNPPAAAPSPLAVGNVQADTDTSPPTPNSGAPLAAETARARDAAPGNPRLDEYARDRQPQLQRLEHEIDALVRDFAFARYLIAGQHKTETILAGVAAVAAAGPKVAAYLQPTLVVPDGDGTRGSGGLGDDAQSERDTATTTLESTPAASARNSVASAAGSAVSSAHGSATFLPKDLPPPPSPGPIYLLPPAHLPPPQIPLHPLVEKLSADLILILSSLLPPTSPPSSPSPSSSQASPAITPDPTIHPLAHDRRLLLLARCVARLAPVLDPHALARAFWTPLVAPALASRWVPMRAAGGELAEACVEACDAAGQAIAADPAGGGSGSGKERRDVARRYLGTVGSAMRSTFVYLAVDAASDTLGTRRVPDTALAGSKRPSSSTALDTTYLPLLTRLARRRPDLYVAALVPYIRDTRHAAAACWVLAGVLTAPALVPPSDTPPSSSTATSPLSPTLAAACAAADVFAILCAIASMHLSPAAVSTALRCLVVLIPHIPAHIGRSEHSLSRLYAAMARAAVVAEAGSGGEDARSVGAVLGWCFTHVYGIWPRTTLAWVQTAVGRKDQGADVLAVR
ncbi:hypothetical protein M427DRAFT_382474 [Gonapodya prolifera JEL478]|uniref:Uncharacterized protein n=1 Tax=Gonapodya prolifera (strain JEL478) TaxID=1344416 RepID=A0A139A926_GONPJ|nr:hypothetical protein M427DRAFT_382474 [Gonapodya prolifera JEL478]|eukprot:KXS13300.1 hypothetical protein M427DRAFT_382474 [Gonapodya prolifera JEL478]